MELDSSCMGKNRCRARVFLRTIRMAENRGFNALVAITTSTVLRETIRQNPLNKKAHVFHEIKP